MEAPICLIEKLQDGRLQVNAEAIEILSKIKQPLAVVATVGMYRTGKSYMMNKLAGFEKGFQLGATVQGKTKGIWMWCVPHPRLKEHTLVLLDTEGLGDVQKGNKKNDTHIFCLSVLLSSVLVYNSIRTIDEDAVEKLRFVGELAELIKVRSEDNEDNECQFSRHFPSFIWLVRDFTLNLEMDGKKITEDEYLENALLPGESEETEETSMRNHSRHAIRMYFNTRKCFVFDSPTGDKNILQRMDEVSVEDLSSIFVEQCQRFCEYIYKNAEVKYLDDITPVSGEILGQLVYKYTEALSSSGIVCMEDTVIRISEEQNKAAVQEATEYYEKRMKERVHFPTETLEEFVEISTKCEEEALEIFMKRSFRDSDLNFHKQYMRNIEEKKKHFSNMNETESRNYCDQLIKKHSGDLEEALKQSLYSKPGGYKKFQEDIKLIQQRYNSEPRKGVEAQSVLNNFINSKESLRIFILVTDETLTELQRQNEGNNVNTTEIVSPNNEVIANNQKRTFGMHLTQLLRRRKNENSRQVERLERVIESKRRERDVYFSFGCNGYARIYDDHISSLSREVEGLRHPNFLQRFAAYIREHWLEILPYAITIIGSLIIVILRTV